MRQFLTIDPPEYYELNSHIFPRLVSRLKHHGLPHAEAEEIANEVLWCFILTSNRAPSCISDPAGWIYQRAAWRAMDWRRS